MTPHQSQIKELNRLAGVCHAANIKWWHNIDTGAPLKRNKFELLALAISEVSECLEGERKNLMDDKLPHRRMPEVEMADTKIRLLDFSAGFNIPAITYFNGDLKVPENKGEALYKLMGFIHNIGSKKSDSWWLTHSLLYIAAYCKKWGYDLGGAISEKQLFNATREDHTHEARKIAGGKQF